MDLIFIGITDIIIVLLVVIALILGYKKGFMQKFLSLASWIVSLVLSIIFCSDFSAFLKDHNFIYPNINHNVYHNILEKTNGETSLEGILNTLGLPDVLSRFIAQGVNPDDSTTNMVQQIADNFTNFIMVIISFFILFFGIMILVLLLKLIVALVRNITAIRIIDGILGLFLYGFLSIIVVFILLFILSLIIQIPALDGFKNFMVIDMQLDTEKFRLSKYLYENNILINLFKIFL